LNNIGGSTVELNDYRINFMVNAEQIEKFLMDETKSNHPFLFILILVTGNKMVFLINM